MRKFVGLIIALLLVASPAWAEHGEGSKLERKSRVIPADNVKIAKLKDPIKSHGVGGYCVDCHKQETPGIFAEWSKSVHGKMKIGCNECHLRNKRDKDAILHADRFYISSTVTPFVCGKCHKSEEIDFRLSGHALARDLLTKMKEDDPRYPIVSQYKEDGFAACAGCHGGDLLFVDKRVPDPATWPSSGAGRYNQDQSKGDCTICHLGHRFSVAQARQPETCNRCHDGANYPEGDIYRTSLHGLGYDTLVDKSVLETNGYFLDGDKMAFPTCSFCHLNGSGHGLKTRHNPAWRLPRDLTGPLASEASRKENLRNNMKSVCKQCHGPSVIDRFFAQADSALAKYQKETVEPAMAEYQQKLKDATGEDRKRLLAEYASFMAEAKGYRMNLYMGRHGRTQR